MEDYEIKNMLEKDLIDEEQKGLDEKVIAIVGDIIIEFKKAGSLTSSQLFDKLSKVPTTPSDIEEIYRMLEVEGIQVVNEFEREKDLFSQ